MRRLAPTATGGAARTRETRAEQEERAAGRAAERAAGRAAAEAAAARAEAVPRLAEAGVAGLAQAAPVVVAAEPPGLPRDPAVTAVRRVAPEAAPAGRRAAGRLGATA